MPIGHFSAQGLPRTAVTGNPHSCLSCVFTLTLGNSFRRLFSVALSVSPERPQPLAAALLCAVRTFLPRKTKAIVWSVARQRYIFLVQRNALRYCFVATVSAGEICRVRNFFWKNEKRDDTFVQFFERLLIKKGRGIGPVTP